MGIVGKMEVADDGEVKSSQNAEDDKFSGQLADGVGRIKVSIPTSETVISPNPTFLA